MKQNTIDDFINKWTSKKYLLTASLFLIFLYILPYFIFGKNLPVRIHDNLDSNIVWVKMLLDSGQIFSSSSSPINQAMNGIPRGALYANYDISLLAFWIFGMYWGYAVNKAIMAVVGFCGMYLLLQRHFIPETKHRLIQFGVATTFALLPFWSFSLSVAGLPLLLYAFLNIRSRENRYGNWLVIGLFPFCSSLILTGIFFIAIIVLIAAHDTFKTKSVNYYLFTGLFLIVVMYVISHYHLFYLFFIDSEYVSHRHEFKLDLISQITGITAIKLAIRLFTVGQWHAHSRHTLFLIPIAISLLFMWKSKEMNKKFILLLAFTTGSSIFYGFWFWEGAGPVKNFLLALIPIQLQRFFFLSPMFWHVLFGISLAIICNQSHIGKYFVLFFLILQLGHVFRCHEVFLNRKEPSFREFYAEKQFQEIKSFIGKPQDSYRVISLGIQAAVSQYNGFYTLDGFVNSYPLSYKHKFRKIIACELEKDSEFKALFDHWGCYCYAFSSELGMEYMSSRNMYSKNNTINIERLDFDINAFKAMDGKFVISSVQINTLKNQRYNLLKVFTNKDSFWTIYLYKVI